MTDSGPHPNHKPGFFTQFLGNTRDRLASKIINFCMLIIILMLIAFFSLMIAGKTAANFENIKDVFTMILPVIGTWVGTVIACYFSRDNFQTASEQTRALAQLNTPTGNVNTPAIHVMQLLSDKDVKRYVLEKDNGLATFRSKKLKTDILDVYLHDPRINRLPVQDANKRMIYVIHQSFITNFIVSQNANAELTVGDLLDSDKDNILTRFATVGIEDKLMEVKTRMDKDPCCQDVFITHDGSRDAPAIGWITNIRLEEYVTVK